MSGISFASGTHVGLVRKINEDSYIAIPELGLWIVADGMGGNEAGEVASRLAVTEIVNAVMQGYCLCAAIDQAHKAIQKAQKYAELKNNMGSTVVAAKVELDSFEVAWVGDSRAYLWDGSLHQLTTDHTYVQLLFEEGYITASEMINHPSRNIVSQALGVGGQVDSSIKVGNISRKLSKGDLLLLCSDGLSSLVSNDIIKNILSEYKNNQERVDRLISEALRNGGKDNVTVIVIARD